MIVFNHKIKNQQFSPVFKDGVVESQIFDGHTYVWYGKRIDPSKLTATEDVNLRASEFNGDLSVFVALSEGELKGLDLFLDKISHLHCPVILHDFQACTQIGNHYWSALGLGGKEEINYHMNTNCSDKDCLVEGGEGSLEITLLYIGKECSSGKMK